MVSKERLEAICGGVALEFFPAKDKVSRMSVMYKRYSKIPGSGGGKLKR